MLASPIGTMAGPAQRKAGAASGPWPAFSCWWPQVDFRLTFLRHALPTKLMLRLPITSLFARLPASKYQRASIGVSERSQIFSDFVVW